MTYPFLPAAVDSNRHVLLHLYYKEGPCPEVAVEEVRAQILDPATNETLFAGLALTPTEFSRGSGWPIHVDKERRAEFTEFLHKKVDSNLLVVVEIRMKESLFEPLNYLPDVETAFRSQRIEKAVHKFVDDVINGKIRIPDLEHVDEKVDGSLADSHPTDRMFQQADNDKFTVHRLIFIYGVDAVSREISENDSQSEICEQLVRNVSVLLPSASCQRLPPCGPTWNSDYTALFFCVKSEREETIIWYKHVFVPIFGSKSRASRRKKA